MRMDCYCVVFVVSVVCLCSCSNYLTSISSPTMDELRHFIQHGKLMV